MADDFLRPPSPQSEHRLHKQEDEYFARRDAEWIKAKREQLDAERTKQERAQHNMRCPRCGGELVETDFGNVKIDRCRDCGGAWLDQGELEMLVHTTEDSGIRRVVRDLLGVKFR